MRRMIAPEEMKGGSIADATKTTKGKVQVGNNINVNDGVISSPLATADDYGVTTFNEVRGYVVSDLDGTTGQTITDAIAGNITDDLAIGMAVDNKITSGITGKQDKLVSGTNIKTINNTSLLGPGNIDISSGGTYTLPVATDTVLGGVKAIAKTTETSEVAVDSDGKLWATAGGSTTGLTLEKIEFDDLAVGTDISALFNSDDTPKKIIYVRNLYLTTTNTGTLCKCSDWNISKDSDNNWILTAAMPYSVAGSSGTLVYWRCSGKLLQTAYNIYSARIANPNNSGKWNPLNEKIEFYVIKEE